MFYPLIKPLLFLQNPENAHYSAMKTLSKIASTSVGKSILTNTFCPSITKPPIEIAGLSFPHPVGLAAGFDKNGSYIDALSCLGFGFIEIGTVTPLAQDGNPKPRLFRLPKEDALINRMGFNNEGIDAVQINLKKRQTKTIVGGNIGKNKLTSNENAVEDYLKGYEALYEFVDYFVVNVSSPNTPNLRALQEKKPLLDLLNQLQLKNNLKQKPKPIFLKIAPDLDPKALEDVLEIVFDTNIAGIVATNTTIERNLKFYSSKNIEKFGAGGLSGKPLLKKSTEVIRFLRKHGGNNLPIIAVGGIFDTDDAQLKLDAGANLLQVYTGLIYKGPSVVNQILSNLIY